MDEADEVTRLRACVARLTLALAEASGEVQRWRPRQAPILPPKGSRKKRAAYHRRECQSADVKELAQALERWHRGTGSIMLPAEVLLAIVKGLGYRKGEV